jgi:hypothetical protein
MSRAVTSNLSSYGQPLYLSTEHHYQPLYPTFSLRPIRAAKRAGVPESGRF